MPNSSSYSDQIEQYGVMVVHRPWTVDGGTGVRSR